MGGVSTLVAGEKCLARALKELTVAGNKQDMTASNRATGKKCAVHWTLMLALLLAAWSAVSGRAPDGAKGGQVTDSDVGEVMGRLSLPFKYFSLSLKEPDMRLVMPVRGVRVQEVKDTWGAARDGGRQHAGRTSSRGIGHPFTRRPKATCCASARVRAAAGLFSSSARVADAIITRTWINTLKGCRKATR